LFVSENIALVQFECPRDVQNECQDQYRRSDALENDVKALLEMVKKKIPFTKVSHIGHLGGTVNATTLSTKGGVDSTILLAPPDPYNEKAKFTGASVFKETPLNTLKTKVLVIAHEDTECLIAKYENAERLAKGVAFVTVKGYSAIDQASRAGCANLGRHGFIGREREVGAAVLNFIEGIGTPPKEIR
jgi:predicted alpha/beta hydrolase family esterase